MDVVFCQAEDGIRGSVASRGIGDVYKRRAPRNGERVVIGLPRMGIGNNDRALENPIAWHRIA